MYTLVASSSPMKLAPDSAEAIADLNGQDIKTVMLTGDAEAEVQITSLKKLA